MRVSMARPAIVAVAAVLAAGCSGDDGSTALPDDGRADDGRRTVELCGRRGSVRALWEEVLPLGSGAFPTGSGNMPEWEPGKFPLTLTPQVAFDGDLWMTAQVVAYSSPDGLVWTEHQKTDTRERIYSSVVFFDDRLWMFGGFDYDTRTFLNDVWVSSDGVTWTNEGPAAWSPRGGHAVVAYRDRLWLLGGADHVADDLSLDRFLNDVWVSDDGLVWSEATAGAPWPAATIRARSCSTTRSMSSAGRTMPTSGDPRMARDGRCSPMTRAGGRVAARRGQSSTGSSGSSEGGRGRRRTH